MSQLEAGSTETTTQSTREPAGEPKAATPKTPAAHALHVAHLGLVHLLLGNHVVLLGLHLGLLLLLQHLVVTVVTEAATSGESRVESRAEAGAAKTATAE